VSEERYALDMTSAAKFIGVSKRTLCRMLSAHKVPKPFRLGQKLVFKRHDLQRWVDLSAKRGEALGRAEFERITGASQ